MALKGTEEGVPVGVIIMCGDLRSRGPFLESPDNFLGPESYFMSAMFTLKTQILLVLKAEQ